MCSHWHSRYCTVGPYAVTEAGSGSCSAIALQGHGANACLLPGKSGTQGLEEAEEDGRVDAIAQRSRAHTPADPKQSVADAHNAKHVLLHVDMHKAVVARGRANDKTCPEMPAPETVIWKDSSQLVYLPFKSRAEAWCQSSRTC